MFCIFSVQIEIAIGIGIAISYIVPADRVILLNLVASSAQSAEHRGHAVEFMLPALALWFFQRFANNQNILNGGTFLSSIPIAIPISISIFGPKPAVL